MDQHVGDLALVIEQLGVAPAHLVGHSYGAFLCLLLAIRRPQLVGSLVLTEPPVIPLFVSNPPAVVVKFGAQSLAPATEAFRKGDHERGLEIFGKAALGAEAFAALPAARKEQMRDNLIAAEFLGSGFSALQDDWIRKIQSPVLLPIGTRSPRLFHRLCERLQELLPDARRVDIQGASHAVHEDNAPAFDQAVVEFLDSVQDRSPLFRHSEKAPTTGHGAA
jgi:pimeloyl-ACP methyl ester carboxylesterase